MKVKKLSNRLLLLYGAFCLVLYIVALVIING
ncbi:hypothetical protein Spica_2645 [Gracilinema caldarium DSM 7334]|uniref:Uncharacterized protein n=1 Tax=Gracilinema caldarium (strain ATCC 51460 / DSM 7334 / H1) TaxID=744872 RepID=F8EZL9_GRAC1|nr:hypothetical protein Spica_2645 [Gracilinema caldarium DSM 7334]